MLVWSGFTRCGSLRLNWEIVDGLKLNIGRVVDGLVLD